MRWVLGCSWFIAVGVLSFLPHGTKSALRSTGPLHLTGHVAIFAISAVVAASLARQTVRILVSCAAVAAGGLLIEALQSYFNSTPFEYADVAADVAGVCLGLLFHLYISRKR